MASSSPTPVGGYPKEIIIGNLDTKFVCNHCRLILRDPVQSFCGHRFCRACIESVIASGSEIRCAICIEEGVEDDYSIIQKDQMFPDNAVKREMSKLPVRCFYPGCNWTGNFRAFENDHLKSCNYRLVMCPSCGENVSLAMLEPHQKQECSNRQLQCKHCKMDIFLKEQEEHNKVCLKFPMKCDACGKKKIPRDKLQQHIDSECQNQKVSCPAGCGLFERSRLQEHINSNITVHTLWMMQEMDGLKTQIQQINQVSSAPPDLEQQLQERDARVTALERQVVDIVNHGLTGAQGTETIAVQIVDRKLVPLTEKSRTLEAKVGTFEGIVATLHREIDKIISALERNERHKEEERQSSEEAKRKILSLERTLALKDIALTEQDLRIQSLEFASYEGSLVWKIADFSQKQQEASRGKSISIYSPAFYTSRLGYKLCARLYPNGDGMGKGTHVSLFFVVMRGHYDPLLPWPFKQRVTFMLVNQLGGDHVLDSFRPDPSSSSFRRPTSDMNIASGSPLFISLAAVQDPSNGYLKDNTMYIKISVDTANLREPLVNDERISLPVS